jgi:KDO2-lipid IV(A) lauroyltransferase
MQHISLWTFLVPRYWYAWPILAGMLMMSLLLGKMLWILGWGLESLSYRFPSHFSHVAERNTELCFPNLGTIAHHKLVQKKFRLFDFDVMSPSVAWWVPEWRLRQFITIRNSQFLVDLIAGGKT